MDELPCGRCKSRKDKAPLHKWPLLLHKKLTSPESFSGPRSSKFLVRSMMVDTVVLLIQLEGLIGAEPATQ
jgi:hypothetical protein